MDLDGGVLVELLVLFFSFLVFPAVCDVGEFPVWRAARGWPWRPGWSCAVSPGRIVLGIAGGLFGWGCRDEQPDDAPRSCAAPGPRRLEHDEALHPRVVALDALQAWLQPLAANPGCGVARTIALIVTYVYVASAAPGRIGRRVDWIVLAHTSY